MTCIYRVCFVKPSDFEPGTVVPREVAEVLEPNRQVVGVEKTADGAVVRLAIPLQRRADSRFIILSALEKLREQFPYQPFLLSWNHPALAVNEHQRELSKAH